jgi:hypothetical protein
MLGALMGTASHANARVDAFRDARAAMQMIERDLRNLIRTQWNPDPFTSPAPSPCAASGLTTTAVTLPAAYFSLNNLYTADPATGNQQLYAIVADRENPSSGDVCAVGYYCRWDNQTHAYSLRRYFRRFSLTDMQGWGATYAPESLLYSPSDSDAVLAAYVWNLQIALYDAAGNRYSTYPCVCERPAATPTMLPAAIEISFYAMSPQAARTVMSVSSDPILWMSFNASPTPPLAYTNLIAPHVYQFRSRINLP